jgi:hypothetical protein
MEVFNSELDSRSQPPQFTSRGFQIGRQAREGESDDG